MRCARASLEVPYPEGPCRVACGLEPLQSPYQNVLTSSLPWRRDAACFEFFSFIRSELEAGYNEERDLKACLAQNAQLKELPTTKKRAKDCELALLESEEAFFQIAIALCNGFG